MKYYYNIQILNPLELIKPIDCPVNLVKFNTSKSDQGLISRFMEVKTDISTIVIPRLGFFISPISNLYTSFLYSFK
jgi:hypothetical protein